MMRSRVETRRAHVMEGMLSRSISHGLGWVLASAQHRYTGAGNRHDMGRRPSTSRYASRDEQVGVSCSIIVRACVVDEQRAVNVQHRAIVAGNSERERRGRVAGDADVACGARGLQIRLCAVDSMPTPRQATPNEEGVERIQMRLPVHSSAVPSAHSSRCFMQTQLNKEAYMVP